jgi:hypothetical protein
MLFEINNPNKVKPYFDSTKPLIERNPELFYKIGFIIEFVIILALLPMVS